MAKFGHKDPSELAGTEAFTGQKSGQHDCHCWFAVRGFSTDSSCGFFQSNIKTYKSTVRTETAKFILRLNNKQKSSGNPSHAIDSCQGKHFSTGKAFKATFQFDK